MNARALTAVWTDVAETTRHLRDAAARHRIEAERLARMADFLDQQAREHDADGPIVIEKPRGADDDDQLDGER